MIIVNIIILTLNVGLSKLITHNINFNSILAVLILCKFIDKINFVKFDKIFIRDVFKYYILPLVVLLFIDIGYSKLIYKISELYESWMVNYTYTAMVVLYEILITNITIVMLVILFNDRIDFKTNINISAKFIFILSSIILILILSIKLSITFMNENKTDSKINMLNNALQIDNLNEYYKLDLEPNIKLEDEDEIFDKLEQYMLSFNDILIKGVSSGTELVYKTATNGLQDIVNGRRMTIDEALQDYRERAEDYIYRLHIYKKDLWLQNVSNIIIYFGNIIFIYLVYKKCTNYDVEYK